MTAPRGLIMGYTQRAGGLAILEEYKKQ